MGFKFRVVGHGHFSDGLHLVIKDVTRFSTLKDALEFAQGGLFSAVYFNGELDYQEIYQGNRLIRVIWRTRHPEERLQ